LEMLFSILIIHKNRNTLYPLFFKKNAQSIESTPPDKEIITFLYILFGFIKVVEHLSQINDNYFDIR